MIIDNGVVFKNCGILLEDSKCGHLKMLHTYCVVQCTFENTS